MYFTTGIQNLSKIAFQYIDMSLFSIPQNSSLYRQCLTLYKSLHSITNSYFTVFASNNFHDLPTNSSEKTQSILKITVDLVSEICYGKNRVFS